MTPTVAMEKLALHVFLCYIIAINIASGQKIIFQDDFDTFDFKTWQHELTMAGGGNWEFEWYVNNRSNSYVKDGVLYVMPTLTVDAIGPQTLTSGDVNIWGGAPADLCTMNSFYGCERNAASSGNVINPVQSARIRTVNSFSFTYGRVEVVAQLPRGDWLWPAIWLMPKYEEYGGWPASGEIDIMESRGNDPSYPSGGNNMFGSTLHWGPDYTQNRYNLTHMEYSNGATSLADDFHTYGLYWDSSTLYTYFDNPSNVVLKVDFTEPFWQKGNFSLNYANPWTGEPNSAPFNRDFYLLINLAVGGTNGYFPDGQGGKPWNDSDPHAVNAFNNAQSKWYPTWNGSEAALKIQSVKVWSLPSKAVQNIVSFHILLILVLLLFLHKHCCFC